MLKHLMLEQSPINEQRPDVLLLPVKLRKNRRDAGVKAPPTHLQLTVVGLLPLTHSALPPTHPVHSQLTLFSTSTQPDPPNSPCSLPNSPCSPLHLTLPTPTHPVLHGLLDEREALPARVELLLVRASEKHEVADDLRDGWKDGQRKGMVRPFRNDSATSHE